MPASWLVVLALGSAPATDTTVGVGVMRMSGPEGQSIARSLQAELEPPFTVHVLTTPSDDVSCDRLDRSCLLELGRKLAPERARYAVIETSSTPDRTIAVCDLHEGRIIRVLRFRDNEEDLVLAHAVPLAIANTIRDHHTPQPPITAEEKLVIATLDEPPRTEEPPPCEPHLQVCLSVLPDGDVHRNWCPETSGPPPVRRLRCATADDSTPSPDLLALLLLAAARRRREVIDRLAADERLPTDVVRRLRGDPGSR